MMNVIIIHIFTIVYGRHNVETIWLRFMVILHLNFGDKSRYMFIRSFHRDKICILHVGTDRCPQHQTWSSTSAALQLTVCKGLFPGPTEVTPHVFPPAMSALLNFCMKYS